MFLESLKFEWKYFTRQPSFFITSAIFLLLPFLALTVEKIVIGSASNVNVNSPYAIIEIYILLSIFAMFLAVNFVGNTALRNQSSGFSEIIVSKPLRPLSYNLGRFLGSYLICLTVFLMIPVGTFLGSLSPTVDSEVIGPNKFEYYLKPFLIFTIPTLFVYTSIFFVVAKRSKSMMVTYMSAIILYIIFNVASTVLDQPDEQVLKAMIEPFGLSAFDQVTQYWTMFERNSKTVGFSGLILQNRIVWAGFALMVLFIGGRLFKHEVFGKPNTAAKKAKKSNKVETVTTFPSANNIKLKPAQRTLSAALTARTKFETKQTITSPGFSVLLIASVILLFCNIAFQESPHGQPYWPVTNNVIEVIEISFSILMLAVIAYFTADVVWRDKENKIGDIIDSTPTSNFVFWSSKLISIGVVLIVIMSISMLLGVSIQALQGYHDFELNQYVIRLFYFNAYTYFLIAILAFFFQMLSPNKYIGILVFAIYALIKMMLAKLGVEHNMFNYASTPKFVYSDMNKFGEYIQTYNWYMLYWTSLAVFLSVITFGLWRRGVVSTLSQRLKQLRYQLQPRGLLVMAFSLIAFVGAGYHIHYNTRIVNQFLSSQQQLGWQVDYEKKYSQYKDRNVPMVVSVDIDVAIFPKRRRVEANANIVVENQGKEPISRVLITYPRHTKEIGVEIAGGTLKSINNRLRGAWFEFDTPLRVGERRSGVLKSVIDHDGFKDRDEDLTVVENGTFINNFELLPHFGYRDNNQIIDRQERRKYGLPELERANSLEDSEHYHEHFIDRAATFIDFSATISTDLDQTAMAPGYLTKVWEEDGRKYFRYDMDSPMLNFYCITSARLVKKREVYKDISLEIYHHPSHQWNIGSMMESTKDTLDYMQTQFGPYQHRQYRIVEFPKYRGFAQSFANTVPFSEMFWTYDQRSEKDINFIYFVNAHELAHQWWGHQLGSANVQGAAVLSETLAEYTALAVMEKKFGDTRARHFLSYELDGYLKGRSSEKLYENPLMRDEGQAYIHYQKGSVAMMVIRHKIGEQRLNSAVKALLDEFKYKSDPYPTSLDLLRHLKSGATMEEKDFIDDLFAKIILFDMRAKEAEIEELDSGQFKISLSASVSKYQADGQGKETEQEFEGPVEIAVFASDPNDFSVEAEVIYKGEHNVRSGNNRIVLVVDQKPTHIGFDPFIRYIDRNTDDNVLKL